MAARKDAERLRREKIGAQCVAIAGILFPHFSDANRREQLAVALMDISRLLIEQAVAVPVAPVRENRVRRLG